MQPYDYLKSVFMPYAYLTPKSIPDIPFQGGRARLQQSGQDASYSVPPGGVVEALFVAPCLVTDQYDGTFSELVSFFSALNPPKAARTILDRYGTGHDSISFNIGSAVSAYLHKASGFISASSPVSYEACTYVKTLVDNLEDTDIIFSTLPKLSGVLQVNNKIWLNAIPLYSEKRAFEANPSNYRPGVCVHYLVRVKNTNAVNVNVIVKSSTAYAIAERDGYYVADTDAVTNKSSPLGFNQYVLELLRPKYSIFVYNEFDPDTLAAKKIELEADIKTAINTLAQNWYDLLKGIPGIDLNKLINFIIFYIE